MDIEPFEAEERRQARWDRYLAGLPRCRDCGRPVVTEDCLCMDAGAYLCWDCVLERRRDTREEFEPED